MTRKKEAPEERGIRTFLLYILVVAFLILCSFSVKVFSVIKHSKFDGANQFTFLIAKDGRVGEIVSFEPSSNSLSILKIKNGPQASSAGRVLEIPFDSQIEAPFDFNDIGGFMMTSFLKMNSVKTDMTIFDLGRLAFILRKVPESNRTIKEVASPADREIDKFIPNLFIDEKISSENLSVQIVNASEIPGMGKRLERALSNIGVDIVSLSTSHKSENASVIQFSDKESYTLNKLSGILKFPKSKTDKAFANLVIIIGKDAEKSEAF